MSIVDPTGRLERYVETSPPCSRRMRKRRAPGGWVGRGDVVVGEVVEGGEGRGV
jgi:hypothetical protein